MTIKELQENALLPQDLNAEKLATLLDCSIRSAYDYMKNGLTLDKVEILALQKNSKMLVSFQPPEVELYNEPHQKFLKRISDNLKKCMNDNYFTLEKMARKSRLPISAIQEVLDCKCNDFKIIMIVCTVVRVTVKFEYIGGKPPMYDYETIWDNSLIYSEEPMI